MTNLPPDTELEFELQELYILCKHWMQDLRFVEDEIRFFKNILAKYRSTETEDDQKAKHLQFSLKIDELEGYTVTLKIAVPQYLNLLKPFITDLKKEMHLDLVLKYNDLETEIQTLFWKTKKLKCELLCFIEELMSTQK
jgi:hypothetical protein